MIDPSTLGVFLAAGFLLLMTPGPAVIYIVTRSVEQGRRAGLVSVLGICTGRSPTWRRRRSAFRRCSSPRRAPSTCCAISGRPTLIVLGLRTLSKREPEAGAVVVASASLRRIFLQGVIVNPLNPHTALFFFAFLPQFVNPSRGAVPLQIVTLGLIFILIVGDDRCRVSDRRRHRRQLDQGQPPLRACAAIRHRLRAHRARRRRRCFGTRDRRSARATEELHIYSRSGFVLRRVWA